MTGLDRRAFLKLVGGGTAALGMGISVNACGQKEAREAQKAAEAPKAAESEWEFS